MICENRQKLKREGKLCAKHYFDLKEVCFEEAPFCIACRVHKENFEYHQYPLELRDKCMDCHFGVDDDYSIVCHYNPKTIRKGRCDICNFFKRKENDR